MRGIVITFVFLAFLSQLFSQDYGNTYVDISKVTVGGTIEPGDTLNIRSTFVVKSGSGTLCSFSDVILPKMVYIPGANSFADGTGAVCFTREWVLRGFIYITDPRETSMSIDIRNNIPQEEDRLVNR